MNNEILQITKGKLKNKFSSMRKQPLTGKDLNLKSINRYKRICNKIKTVKEISLSDISFIHIKELTYEEEFPKREAFENVISSIRELSVNIIYLLMGDSDGVSLYVGVAKDFSSDVKCLLNVKDVGKNVLQSSIESNFRGCKVSSSLELNKEIHSKISSFKRYTKVAGVPSVNVDNEGFQGVERVIDAMRGREFALMIIAGHASENEEQQLEDAIYELYTSLMPLSKFSKQSSNGENGSITQGYSKGENRTTGDSTSTNTADSKGISHNFGESKAEGNNSSNTTNNSGRSTSRTLNYSKNKTRSKSTTETNSDTGSYSEGYSHAENISREYCEKLFANRLKYIDEVLLPRLNYGKNKGIFNSAIYLLANERGDLHRLGNTITSIFSGSEENLAPLKVLPEFSEQEHKCIINFQLPTQDLSDNEQVYIKEILFSNSVGKLANWLSAKELSVVCGIPQKEVEGLALREEVDFGLNIDHDIDDKLILGNLVKSGTELNKEVFISKSDLSQHTFITGVTGSGKTTTCLRLLNELDSNFLVIEPAKTEYRILAKHSDVLVFTLNNELVAPLRLNPLEFKEGENISSRVDMIKACIESAFDMEAAIPQIIEEALYNCYEKLGWNIRTNKNERFEDPFAPGVYSFPRFQDLINETDNVVKNKGFDERLKNDYIGSIRARLQGLLVGSKGLMLNNYRSVDFASLLEQNVVIELEEVKNSAEKSLIMGFILINLNEAIKVKYKDARSRGKKFQHVTLIEEAHRLLSKYIPGENPTKKLGIESFTDMLAEVRKYGESLIIVDQIPQKLTSEVLKNTSTKIVHKLFAEDDKNAIGNTMALDIDQKKFLSSLPTGRAIISNPRFPKPVQIQILYNEKINTSDTELIDDCQLREICMNFYTDNYKQGFIPLVSYLETVNRDILEKYINFDRLDYIISSWKNIFSNIKSTNGLGNKIAGVLSNLTDEECSLMELFIIDILYKPIQDLEQIKRLEENKGFIKRFRDKEEIVSNFTSIYKITSGDRNE